MEPVISSQNYGKSRVRVTKVTRHGDGHRIRTMSVFVELFGDFEAVYDKGDNRNCVATDTMKNTCYAIAADNDFNCIEEYANILSKHFVTRYPQIFKATAEVFADQWSRMPAPSGNNGTLSIAATGAFPAPQGEHLSAFFHRGDDKRWCKSTSTKANNYATECRSGMVGMSVLRTAGSEFSNFHNDEFATLQGTTDRIFATVVDLKWSYNTPNPDYNRAFEDVRGQLMFTFANHHSLSVQATQYEVLRLCLQRNSQIEHINSTLPNKHHIPFDLTKLGNRKNKNEIFITTDEPYGLINLGMSRKRSAKL